MAIDAEIKSKEVVDQRLVKALAHPLRAHILGILNERVASPNQLSKELDEGLSQVSYHIKVLRDYECIELVKTEPRRGALEHFYRGTRRVLIEDSTWEQLSPAVREGISMVTLQMTTNHAMRAIEAGTFDARIDSHMSYTPVILDEEGWKDLAAVLGKALDDVLEIQAQSAGRLAEARADGFPATVALMSFESPSPERNQLEIADGSEG